MYSVSRFFFITAVVAIGCPTSTYSAEKKAINGPVINVTKHVSFPDFSLYDSRINRDVALLGSASISQVKKCIQMPDATQDSDLRHVAGRALYSSPIRLLDPATQTPASFETTFSFQFQTPINASNYSSNHNKTTSSEFSLDDSAGGSGLTFLVVPDEFTVGRSGPWLGMLNDVCDDDYKVVAIEFDTHQNSEFGDPNDNHVGINLGSIVSTTAVNASEVGVYLKDGSIYRAWISYDGQKKHMDIHLGKEGENYPPPKPLFSGPLDLSPFLKEYMFIGFSASTGNSTQIHHIMSWNFTSTSQASLRVPSTETCEAKIISDGNRNNDPRPRTRSEPPSSFLIFLAVVILLFAVLINLYLSGRRKRQESDENNVVLPENKQRPRPPNKPRKFTTAEISSATRGFSETQILGGDDKSVTYKAIMINGGCNAAVKRFLPRFFEVQGLDRRRVYKEIKAMSKIRHPNLVPIRGWCFDNKELAIHVVYDYIPNGSLDKWLYGVGVLPWTRRLKAVKDVAEALSYVHSKQLAHKNVKTSSVFLDVSFRAVLGDFGFVLPSFESTRFESIVSQSADVFEFGVFLLEVVAGRGRSGRSNPGGEMDLLEMAWALHERGEKKVSLVDRKMGSVVNPDQAVRVIEVGLLCTLNENKGRPRMEQVVEFLNLDNPIPELPPGRPVSLFPYSSTSGLCSGYSCAPFNKGTIGWSSFREMSQFLEGPKQLVKDYNNFVFSLKTGDLDKSQNGAQ